MARVKPYFELKYLIDNSQAFALKALLQPLCQPDRNGKDGSYEVLSLYYDTPNLQFHRDKIEGVFSRKKVRLRLYRNDLNKQWQDPTFEIKCKKGVFTSKQRKQLADLTLSNLHASNSLAQELSEHPQILIPSALIFYKRQAFFCKGIEGLRLTFDSCFSAIPTSRFQFAQDFNFYQSALLQKLPQIFEIKSYTGVPESLLQLPEKVKAYQTSFSKYATAINLQKQRLFSLFARNDQAF